MQLNDQNPMFERHTLDVSVKLPPKVLVGFTGAVGGITDTHAILNPNVIYIG